VSSPTEIIESKTMLIRSYRLIFFEEDETSPLLGRMVSSESSVFRSVL